MQSCALTLNGPANGWLSPAPQISGPWPDIEFSNKNKKKKGCCWVVILDVMENYGQMGSLIPQMRFSCGISRI
jgi:hypothetical protein